MRTCGDMPNCGGEMRVEPLYSRLIPRGCYTHTPLEQIAGVSRVATLIVSTFVLFLLLNVILQRLSCKIGCRGCCWLAQCLWAMPPSHGNVRLTHQAALLSREKGFAPPWNKTRIEASLFSFHATVKSTALKSAPAAPVHENWQQALSINGAPNMRIPKKTAAQCLLCRFLHTKKREAMKGWMREDPFFVWWQNGGLLQDGMVTCYKGRTKEDRGYVSVHGPLGTLWWLPPIRARLGTPWMNNPPSGCKVVLDS